MSVLFDPEQGPVPDTLEGVVGEAIGAASVCWESMAGTGQFQDQRASQIVDEVVAWIKEHYLPIEPISEEKKAVLSYLDDNAILHVDG